MQAVNVYYDIATRRLDAQMQQIDQIDTKVATLFAAASGILAIFAGLLSLATLPADAEIRVAVLILLGLASAVYIALLVFLFAAFRVGRWHFRPDLGTLRKAGEDYDENAMRQWVAMECETSVNDNAPLIDRKAGYLKYALLALPVEAILLVGAGALTLFVK